MNLEIYDPVNQPTLHAIYTDMAKNPEFNHQPDMWGLINTIQEIDKMIGRIQEKYIDDICAKYEGEYVSCVGHMVFHLTEAVLHGAIRLEQVPLDLRVDVENACLELKRAAK